MYHCVAKMINVGPPLGLINGRKKERRKTRGVERKVAIWLDNDACMGVLNVVYSNYSNI
jgi:hypothetical protein